MEKKKADGLKGWRTEGMTEAEIGCEKAQEAQKIGGR